MPLLVPQLLSSLKLFPAELMPSQPPITPLLLVKSELRTVTLPLDLFSAPARKALLPTNVLLKIETIGSVVTLDAADASKTLKENGVDDSLDFVLGSGGDYLYEWYLDNAETGPKVGTGRSISFTVPFADGVGPDKAASYKVVLKVTDADNQNGNRSATDEFSVSNNQLVPAGKIYLPAVQK